MNSRPAKLVDVAQRAGYSTATVSRVLNGSQSVAADIRDRVFQVAGELGYVPNGSAKSLRSTRSRLVGAIIPTLDHAIYAIMTNALQARLAERSISLILSTSFYDMNLELDQIRMLIEHGVEAIVMVGAIHHPEALKLLNRHRIPYVFTYTDKHGPNGTGIGFDNYQAGATAAKFLYDLGHRRFGMLAGITANNDRATDRVKGFSEALLEFGIPEKAISVREAAYRIIEGQAGAQALLTADPQITALFCGSDTLAAGALKYCAAAGITVPQDLSVLGFDNLDIATLTTPELSTLEVPAKEMGLMAADFILTEPAQRLHLPLASSVVRLVIRESTGPARTTAEP